MRKALNFCIFFLCVVAVSYGQGQQTRLTGKIEGYVSNANAAPIQVVLMGYQGKTLRGLDTASVAADGSFSLGYPKAYRGLGNIKVLGTQVDIPVVLLGNAPNEQRITFKKEGGILFSGQSPNEAYQAYTQNKYRHAEQLDLLTKLSTHYDSQSTFGKAIIREQQSTDKLYQSLLGQLDTLTGDVGYFLRLQESLQRMNGLLDAAQQPAMQQLTDAQKGFEKAVSFADGRLWHSGILHRLLYSYYTLSNVLPGGHQHASDFLLSRLTPSEYKNNYMEEIIAIVQQVPDMAAYFGQKALLAEEQCDDIKGNDTPGRIKRQLGQHSNLRIGATAPDELLQNGKHISEIEGDYKLIVFWASWCDHCKTEIPQLLAMYPALKKQKIEVVAMGMDDNPDIHKIVSMSHTWVSHFVGRDWDTPITQHYFIYGTPTFFLVDKAMKIVAKPKSVAELNQWLERNRI